MATFANVVRLTDAVIPDVYTSYTAIDRPELTAFFQSGAVYSSDFLNAYMALPGRLITIPFWRDLDEKEPNYGNDDPNQDAPIDGLDSGSMRTTKAWLNKSYGAMDMTAELAGSDPMQRIRNRFGVYWTRQWQRRILAMSVGVYKANVAGHFSDDPTGAAGTSQFGEANDMVIDISGAATPAQQVFSREAFVDAAFTLGDHVGVIRAIAVHSVVYKRMTNNDDIEFIPDSQGNLTIPTYMGKLVVVDDGMPVLDLGAGKKGYMSILYGGGGFGYAEGVPAVPAAVKREELKGNGAGLEYIIERKEWLVHPGGWDWLDKVVDKAGSQNGGTTDTTLSAPSLANLANATNWARTTYRKNVPIAFLITAG